MTAAIVALQHRARTGLAADALLSKDESARTSTFWHGYLRALHDLQRGAGAQLAEKDERLGGYQPPSDLAAALACLGEDIDRLIGCEIVQRVAKAGIQLPAHHMANLQPVAAQDLEHAKVTAVDLHDEHAATRVVVGDKASEHAAIVAQGAGQ